MKFSLDMFEDDNFRQFIRDNLIVYKENNGIKVVDDAYTQDVLNTDPIQVIEDFLKTQGVGFNMEKNFPEAFIAMKFNGILKEEISKANADTHRGQSIEEYLSVVDRIGFDVIYDETTFIKDKEAHFESEQSMKEYLKNYVSSKTEIIKTTTRDNGWIDAELNIPEREMILHHPEHNMLLHLDTYNGKTINGSTLIFNVENRDNKNIYDSKLPLSGGFSGKDAQNYIGHIDGIDMLAHKMTTLLTYTKPLEKWLEFDNSLYSHITHKNIEIGDDTSWDQKTIQKMEKFPEAILTSLLEDNIKVRSVQEHFHQKYNMDNDFHKMEKFAEELSLDDKKRLLAYAFVADDFYSGLSTDNKSKLEDLSISQKRFDDYEFHIDRSIRKDRIMEEDLPSSLIKEAIENSDSKKVEKMLKTNEIKFKLYPELKDVKEMMENKVEKQHKNKMKLH